MQPRANCFNVAHLGPLPDNIPPCSPAYMDTTATHKGEGFNFAWFDIEHKLGSGGYTKTGSVLIRVYTEFKGILEFDQVMHLWHISGISKKEYMRCLLGYYKDLAKLKLGLADTRYFTYKNWKRAELFCSKIMYQADHFCIEITKHKSPVICSTFVCTDYNFPPKTASIQITGRLKHF